MGITSDMVRRVTSSAKGTISNEDGARVLEIACLAVVTDDQVAPEELSVLRTVAKDLGGFADIDALVQRAASLATRDEQVERLRAVGESLTTDQARHLAYKVSVLTAMADLAASDEEFEFDLDLHDALQLDGAVADQLSGEVHEAVTLDDD